jgi:hypothetical protein
VYALGDGTDAYNTEREGSTDISLATRSALWLDPSVLVLYDRASSKTDGRFKKLDFTVPATVTVNNRVSTITTAKNQSFALTTLLPQAASIQSVVLPQTDIDESMEQQPIANGEPNNYRRLSITAGGNPKDTRFLHVLMPSGGTYRVAV